MQGIKPMGMMVCLCVALAVGCSNTAFHFQPRNDGEERPAKVDTMSHYFINGLGQQADYDPVTICGGLDKVAKVETQQTFVNGLLRILTWGLYTPQQARVYCSP